MTKLTFVIMPEVDAQRLATFGRLWLQFVTKQLFPVLSLRADLALNDLQAQHPAESTFVRVICHKKNLPFLLFYPFTLGHFSVGALS